MSTTSEARLHALQCAVDLVNGGKGEKTYVLVAGARAAAFEDEAAIVLGIAKRFEAYLTCVAPVAIEDVRRRA